MPADEEPVPRAASLLTCAHECRALQTWRYAIIAGAHAAQADKDALQCSPMYHGGMLGLISVKPHSNTTCTGNEAFMTICMVPLPSICIFTIQQEQASSKACMIQRSLAL